MKKASNAQKWARRRNYGKFGVSGMRKISSRLAKDKILTEGERGLMTDINLKLQTLASQYTHKNFISKKAYLTKCK